MRAVVYNEKAGLEIQKKLANFNVGFEEIPKQVSIGREFNVTSCVNIFRVARERRAKFWKFVNSFNCSESFIGPSFDIMFVDNPTCLALMSSNSEMRDVATACSRVMYSQCLST